MKTRLAALVAALAFTPFVAFADSFADIVNKLVKLVDSAVIPLLYSIAFVSILIGVVRFFFLGGEEGRQKGRVFIFWGILGLGILFALWGIVRLALSILPNYGS